MGEQLKCEPFNVLTYRYRFPGCHRLSRTARTKREGKRKFKSISIQVAEAVIDNLDGERYVFDLINFGGLRQGEVDGDVGPEMMANELLR